MAADDSPQPPDRVAAALPSLERPGVAAGAIAAAAVVRPLLSQLNLPAFRLAGGTGLAWHLGHRVSDDLDFFCFQPGALGPAAQTALQLECERIAIFVRCDISHLATVHTLFHTPPRETQVSWFEVTTMHWVAPPHPTAAGFSIAGLLDIGAMKLAAIGGRSTKKDFYDLVGLERAKLDIRTLYQHALRVVPAIAERSALEHLVHALTDFGPADTDPDPTSLDGTTWEMAKATARRAASDLATELRRPPFLR